VNLQKTSVLIVMRLFLVIGRTVPIVVEQENTSDAVLTRLTMGQLT
jgi:hypothetical protein